MNLESIYSLLMTCSRFFFASWALLLLGVSVVVFRSDLR